MREIEGGYFPSHPFVKEKEIASMTPYKLKWEELHCHFPYLGQYAPEEEEWENVISLESDSWTKDYPEYMAGKVSAEIIKQHITLLHKYGIKSLIYFQCAGDGQIPYITKRFPNSIAKGINGSSFNLPINSCLMNSDPSTSYGKEVLDMIDRLFKLYPNMDGVFLDQLCYNALDFAHDDGVTMFKNKPVYSLWHCYEEPVKKLADKLHQQGKLIFANGPYNVEVQKDIDGHMAEGVPWAADAIKYLCISKPLLFLSYYDGNVHKAESMFQLCLLTGASYSLCPHPSKEVKVLPRLKKHTVWEHIIKKKEWLGQKGKGEV